MGLRSKFGFQIWGGRWKLFVLVLGAEIAPSMATKRAVAWPPSPALCSSSSDEEEGAPSPPAGARAGRLPSRWIARAMASPRPAAPARVPAGGPTPRRRSEAELPDKAERSEAVNRRAARLSESPSGGGAPPPLPFRSPAAAGAPPHADGAASAGRRSSLGAAERVRSLTEAAIPPAGGSERQAVALDAALAAALGSLTSCETEQLAVLSRRVAELKATARDRLGALEEEFVGRVNALNDELADDVARARSECEAAVFAHADELEAAVLQVRHDGLGGRWDGRWDGAAGAAGCKGAAEGAAEGDGAELAAEIAAAGGGSPAAGGSPGSASSADLFYSAEVGSPFGSHGGSHGGSPGGSASSCTGSVGRPTGEGAAAAGASGATPVTCRRERTDRTGPGGGG